MPETDNHPKYEPLAQRRRKAVQAILQDLSDEDVAPEHKNAILLRQDLLFGFRMNLETYEECREALLNPSAAACIYCGTMICSFAENELRMGPAQISRCSATFFQAGEDLILAENAGLLLS